MAVDGTKVKEINDTTSLLNLLPRCPLGNFFRLQGSALPEGVVMSAVSVLMSYSLTDSENSLAVPMENCDISLLSPVNNQHSQVLSYEKLISCKQCYVYETYLLPSQNKQGMIILYTRTIRLTQINPTS